MRVAPFHQKPLWQRYIIVFAGPAFNLIFPTLIYFLFYGSLDDCHRPSSARCFRANLRPRRAFNPGIKWQPLMASESAIGQTPSHDFRQSGRCDAIHRDSRQDPLRSLPHSSTARTGADRLGVDRREGRIGIANYQEPPQVGISDPASPAARGGLQTGDVLTSINGREVRHWKEVAQILAPKPWRQSLRITYLRPGRQSADLLISECSHHTQLSSIRKPRQSTAPSAIGRDFIPPNFLSMRSKTVARSEGRFESR